MYRFLLSFLRRFLRLEVVWVSLVLLALAGVFLAEPILRVRDTYYSPTDILQSFPTFQVGQKPVRPHNFVISDDILTYLPWHEFAQANLRQGQWPLWNPYNGGGRPLLANMQGSFFNPLLWVQFGLGMRLGLLARAFLCLYLAGLFAFGYFKSLGLWVGAALTGAVAFMFGGMMVIWNHTELGATFILLPLLLLVIELRLQQRLDDRQFVVRLSGVMLWQVLAGHPETIYLNSLVSGGYVVFRLATLPAAWGSLRRRLLVAGCYIASGLVGMVLGAIQLLPFVEYLTNSYALIERTRQPVAHLQPGNILTFVLPNPFGNPVYGPKLDFANPNYSEISGGYVGAGVIFLAGCCLWLVRRQAVKWFWVGLVVAGAAVVFGWEPFKTVVNLVSPVAVNYTRLVGYVGFGLITLMALALQAVYQRSEQERAARPAGRRPGRAGWQLGLAGLGGMAALAAVFGWFQGSGLVPFQNSAVAAFQTRQFWFSLGLTGVIAVCVAGLVRWPGWRPLTLAVLVLSVFAQVGWYSRTYRAPTEAAYFYPRNATLERLAHNGGRVAIAGSANWLPAEVNIRYGISQVNGYDSLEVAWFERLRRAAEQRYPGWVRPEMLKLFNIRQVLVSSKNPDFQGPRALSNPQLRRQSKLGFLNIYLNDTYQPPYRMMYRAIECDEPQAIGRLLDGTVDPLDTLVLIRDRPGPSARPGPEPPPLPITAPPVEVVERDTLRTRLRVNNPQPGYLYIDQTYFPGWQARVNGQPQPLERANVAFTALPLGPGAQTIDLEYDPVSFKLGGWVSTGGGLSLLALANVGWLGRRVRRALVGGKAAGRPFLV